MTDLQRAILWLEFMQESGYETETEQQHCRVLLDALRWVPVSERMPETYTDVLCYTKDRQVFVWYLNEKGNWEKREVTHWRPLPAPPKEG